MLYNAHRLGVALTVAIVLEGGDAVATEVGATRARVEKTSLALPASPSRACWARYSTPGAAPSTDVIEETAFRVPCPEKVTGAFVASLQRALRARNFYSGQITGRPDAATRAAVRAYQRSDGFDSPILTLETAQKLGLSPRNFGRN